MFEFAKPIIGIKEWDEIAVEKNVEHTPDLTPKFTVINNGESKYQIITPDKLSTSEDYAAKELQKFVYKISGTTIPIVTESNFDKQNQVGFFIDNCRYSQDTISNEINKLSKDGVVIKTENNGNMILFGQNDRACIYSVYVLLERYLGVRFLTQDCIVIPTKQIVTLPEINYVYTPLFEYRDVLYSDAFPKEISLYHRLNGPFNQLDTDVGGKIIFYPFCHSFQNLVPREKYGKDHPEYFSLIQGTRAVTGSNHQLCLTNPDVLKISTQQVFDWIKTYPDVNIFDVSQNDCKGWCECKNCTKIVEQEKSLHGPIMRFVNAIAKTVAEKCPDKRIMTLAYMYSVKPPEKEKPEENVIIRLCHQGCYFHGFEKCGMNFHFAEYLNQWRKKTKHLYIWHYITNFHHYLAPNPNLHGLASDIKYYANCGVDGLMVQGNHQCSGGELSELRQYLAAQLIWNPSRDPAMIRLEFCNGYYGTAANYVLDYLTLMDEFAKNNDVHGYMKWKPRDVIPLEFIKKAVPILTRARLRANTPEIRNRVEKLLLSLWYIQLTYSEFYKISEDEGRIILADLKPIVEKNKINFIREVFRTREKNVDNWIEQMDTKYGTIKKVMVYDLAAHFSEAEIINNISCKLQTVIPQVSSSTESDNLRYIPQTAIFQHPPVSGYGEIKYKISLPELKEEQKLILTFGTIITGDTKDGVKFNIFVNTQELWSWIHKDMFLANHRTDISQWAGKTVELTLCVSAIENTVSDWSNWVRPQIWLE